MKFSEAIGVSGNIGGTVVTLSIAGDSNAGLYWILPALARNSHRDRWTIWIAPPALPQGAWLTQLGFNVSHTRVVHRREALGDDHAIIEQALRAHTNAIVLAWPRNLSERDVQKLQTAAQQGNTCGLMFLHSARSEDTGTTLLPAKSKSIDKPIQLALHP